MSDGICSENEVQWAFGWRFERWQGCLFDCVENPFQSPVKFWEGGGWGICKIFVLLDFLFENYNYFWEFLSKRGFVFVFVLSI